MFWKVLILIRVVIIGWLIDLLLCKWVMERFVKVLDVFDDIYIYNEKRDVEIYGIRVVFIKMLVVVWFYYSVIFFIFFIF